MTKEGLIALEVKGLGSYKDCCGSEERAGGLCWERQYKIEICKLHISTRKYGHLVYFDVQ